MSLNVIFSLFSWALWSHASTKQCDSAAGGKFAARSITLIEAKSLAPFSLYPLGINIHSQGWSFGYIPTIAPYVSLNQVNLLMSCLSLPFSRALSLSPTVTAARVSVRYSWTRLIMLLHVWPFRREIWSRKSCKQVFTSGSYLRTIVIPYEHAYIRFIFWKSAFNRFVKIVTTPGFVKDA